MPSDVRPQVLFLISSDPRTSHRPAEAVRMAAGVGAWKKADVRVYLHGPAIRVAGEWVDELIGEDDLIRYLPLTTGPERSLLVQADAPELAELGTSPVAWTPVSESELAAWVTRSTYTLRF